MITLKKNSDRRVRRGHLWVFSNEIADPPVSELEPGSVHELHDIRGEFLGMVYASPSSLIAARILSRTKVDVDGHFFQERILSALQRRSKLFPDKDVYRLVYGESDFLPGLIVDRYGRFLAVQSLTSGMDRFLDEILDALQTILEPEGIYLRNDSPFRTLEGLPQEKKPAFGSVPETVTINSHGLDLLVDIANGQKTGYYLDQESNRSVMKQYVAPGTTVLDLFCYTGAWGLHAVSAGAEEVIAVDSSRAALRLAEANAELNGMQDRFHAAKDNAIDFLKKAPRSWDVIVLDPPAFIKSRAQIKEGLRGYIDLNRRALGKLRPGGVLVTCSCSHHMDRIGFEDMLLTAARQSGRELRILDSRGQGPDHPVLLSMPETRYLKVVVAQSV